MARTTRRNKRHLILDTLGDFSRFVNDVFYWPEIHAYRTKLWYIDLLGPLRGKFVCNAYMEAKFHGCTVKQVYDKRLAAQIGDTRSGLHGVPRWYRHEHGAHYNRRVEKHKLHTHQRRDEWDDHLPESRCRDTKYYWWY